eukprot:143280-Lingulodinium_polyedra.AAC.1
MISYFRCRECKGGNSKGKAILQVSFNPWVSLEVDGVLVKDLELVRDFRGALIRILEKGLKAEKAKGSAPRGQLERVVQNALGKMQGKGKGKGKD